MPTFLPSPMAARNEIDKTQEYIVGVNRAFYQTLRVPILQKLEEHLTAPWWKQELTKPSDKRRKYLDLVVENTPLTEAQVRIRSLEPNFHLGWDAFKEEFKNWRNAINLVWPSTRDEAITFRDRAKDWQKMFNRLSQEKGYGVQSGTPKPKVTPGFGDDLAEWLKWLFLIGGGALAITTFRKETKDDNVRAHHPELR